MFGKVSDRRRKVLGQRPRPTGAATRARSETSPNGRCHSGLA